MANYIKGFIINMLSSPNLRLRALELANNPLHSASEVLDKAKQFLEFLDHPVNASSPTAHHMKTWLDGETIAKAPEGFKWADPDATPVAPLQAVFWDDDFDVWSVFDARNDWYRLKSA